MQSEFLSQFFIWGELASGRRPGQHRHRRRNHNCRIRPGGRRCGGYTGAISFDPSRPDGTPRTLLDIGRLAKLGWRARTSVAYQAYLSALKQVTD